MPTKTKLLACRHVHPDNMAIGDTISFVYRWPKTGDPNRCGEVVEFQTDRQGKTLVLVWDYSLRGGSGYRSYRIGGMLDTVKIEERKRAGALEALRAYMRNIEKYTKRWG